MNVGQQFSHYLIEEKIGEGGFGDVFRARDLNSGMEVAMKCSHPCEPEKMNDKEQRFLREVSCISKLRHPNIVQMYEYGTLPDKTLFLVMEYVQGFNLEDLIKREAPFAYAYASDIILQVLDALAAAHAQCIVHRDLKPANIMLVRQAGGRDIVKLLDFGIAKAFDGSTPDLTQISPNLSFGTPHYMSPEQFSGKKLGPYSDLYSAGLIFLELLTGKQAVTGETLIEVAEKQLNGIIEIPEPFSLGPLGDVFRCAFAKSIDMRYASAAEMYRDIDAIIRQRSPFLALYSTAPSRQGSAPFSPNAGYAQASPNATAVNGSGQDDELSTIDNNTLGAMLSRGDNPVDLSGYKTVIFEDGFEGLPEIDESPNAYHPGVQVGRLPSDAPVLLPQSIAPSPTAPPVLLPQLIAPSPTALVQLSEAIAPSPTAPVQLSEAIAPQPTAQRFSQPQLQTVAPPPNAQRFSQPQMQAVAPPANAQRFSQPQLQTVAPPPTAQRFSQPQLQTVAPPSSAQRFSQPQMQAVAPLRPTSPINNISPELPPTEIGDIIDDPPLFPDEMPTDDVDLAKLPPNLSSASTCPIPVPNLRSRAPVVDEEVDSGEYGIKTCAMPSYSEMLKERGEDDDSETNDLPVVFHQQRTKFFTNRQLTHHYPTHAEGDAPLSFPERLSLLIDSLYEKHFLALVIGVCLFIICITFVLVLVVMR